MNLVEIEIGGRGLGVILIVFRFNLRFGPDVLFDIVGQGTVVDPEIWGANSGGTVLVVFYYLPFRLFGSNNPNSFTSSSDTNRYLIVSEPCPEDINLGRSLF
jgi:hypothetical protein